MTELFESFSDEVSNFDSLFYCDDAAALQGLLLFDTEEKNMDG
jgi:hypothetical protein